LPQRRDQQQQQQQRALVGMGRRRFPFGINDNKYPRSSSLSLCACV
jgi:hypothetical protein